MDSSGRLLVILFLHKGNQLTSINDLLIQDEYACLLSAGKKCVWSLPMSLFACFGRYLRLGAALSQGVNSSMLFRKQSVSFL